MHASVEYGQINAQRIKDLIPEYNRPGITFLDIGCGNGTLTYYLQEVFFQAQVTGIDKSEIVIMQARQEYPSINFLVHNILAGDFGHELKFDVLVAVDVLHHVLKKDQAQWLKAAMELLKPGGVFILFELNPWHYSTRKLFNKNPEEKDATMLSLVQSYQLLKNYGKPKLYNFGLPWPFFYAESWLSKIPFGQQYAFTCTKQ